MILPKYSIRTIFYLVVLVALISLVAGQGVQGASWALAFTIAVGSLAVCWVVYIAFYGAIWLFAQLALQKELQQAAGAYYPAAKSSSSKTGVDASNSEPNGN